MTEATNGAASAAPAHQKMMAVSNTQRISELERAVGAAALAFWLDVAKHGGDFGNILPDSATGMAFAAVGFNPLTDDIVAFRNAYMDRFSPREEAA